MSNVITINEHYLAIKEFQGHRVVTFKDIDRLHQRADGTARRNFNSNKNHFVLNDDYFLVKPSNIGMYEIRTPEKINNAGTMFLTETGYLMLVKSFSDDLAWTVQRMLVNSYFRKKEPVTEQPKLEPTYTYTRKQYKLQEVVTFADLEHFTKIARYTLAYHFNFNRELFDDGQDFYFLTGSNLAEFKANNSLDFKLVSNLYVFTRTGVNMFLRCLGIQPKGLPEFMTLPVPTAPPQPTKYPKAQYTDIPENPKAQKTITALREKAIALKVLVDMADRHNTVETLENIASGIKVLGMEICVDCMRFNKIEYGIAENF